MSNEEDNTPTSDEDVDSDADKFEALPPEDSIHEQEDLEPWVEWIKRTTHAVEGHMQKLHIECWTRQVRRRQWKWAHRVTGFSDNRWAKIAAKELRQALITRSFYRFEKRRYFVALTLAEAETIRYAIHVAELNGHNVTRVIGEAASQLVRGAEAQRSNKAVEAAERLKQVGRG